MSAYQRGERQAAERLIAAVTPLLFHHFLRTKVPPAQLEDLIQDCWLRIHKARGTYRSGTPALPWMLAIARHTRVDFYRYQHRRWVREVPIQDCLQAIEAQAATDNPGQRVDLARLLGELPEGQRRVIVMLKMAGMSLEEVARATASTVGAVKQKAHRAYRSLRCALGVPA
jgi:RNA polymerase sigma-70 factor (ECF subfamily)